MSEVERLLSQFVSNNADTRQLGGRLDPNLGLDPKKLNEKKGGVGLWQCSTCVPSALLLKALNFALNFDLNFFLFVPAFFNILCKHYRTNTAKILIPSN